MSTPYQSMCAKPERAGNAALRIQSGRLDALVNAALFFYIPQGKGVAE